MNLAATLRGTTYRFTDVKDVLAKANEEKSGDRLAGVAAASVSERVAAKRVLAELTLHELLENPVVPAERDAVTRLILDDLQRPAGNRHGRFAAGRRVPRRVRGPADVVIVKIAAHGFDGQALGHDVARCA